MNRKEHKILETKENNSLFFPLPDSLCKLFPTEISPFNAFLCKHFLNNQLEKKRITHECMKK